MYLQALPYFDCLKGDYEITKWTLKGGVVETCGKTNTTNWHIEYDDNML
jgi:hypothetical protein